MGNSLRNQPFPSLFPELVTPVSVDLQQIRIYYYFGMIAVSFFLILPGMRGMERCWMLLRVLGGVWIGMILIISNYSAWYGGTVCTKTQYKAHTDKNSPQIIQAEVGLYIGLRGINITLLESPCVSGDYIPPFPDETINYNERFSWANPWNQGRQDFGKYGGRFKQEYRAAKYRGVPYPISWIAEHFLLDGEQIVWYRKFRQAGWYTHAIMWTAFATHLLSGLFFIQNIRMGAIQMAITGALMMIACLVYGVIIRSDPTLEVHFQDQTLVPHFKYAFWLTLSTGIVTFIFACVILILERVCPRKVAVFFHHRLTEDDSFFEMCVDEYETFRDEFGTVSTKCVSKKFNSARKKSTRERTRKSKTDHNGKCEDLIVSRPETIQPIGTLETELKCNNIQKLNSETPTLLYYKQQNQIYSTVESRNSCSSGSHDDSDMEMETQIAEITIHTED